MRTLSVLCLFFVGILSCPASAAEKQKAADVTDYPFWTNKKRGETAQFVPGLTAVLQLSEAQKEKIAAARDEMAGDEAVKAARSKGKGDPNTTPEQREKAQAAVEAARTKLRERVAAVLSSEQKALIEKINNAYAAAVEETGVIYADKFASVKADEAARKRLQQDKSQDTEDQFLHKLDGLLTPGQKEAMAKAADEEQRRNAAAAGAKKPAKK